MLELTDVIHERSVVAAGVPGYAAVHICHADAVVAGGVASPVNRGIAHTAHATNCHRSEVGTKEEQSVGCVGCSVLSHQKNLLGLRILLNMAIQL